MFVKCDHCGREEDVTSDPKTMVDNWPGNAVREARKRGWLCLGEPSAPQDQRTDICPRCIGTWGMAVAFGAGAKKEEVMDQKPTDEQLWAIRTAWYDTKGDVSKLEGAHYWLGGSKVAEELEKARRVWDAMQQQPKEPPKAHIYDALANDLRFAAEQITRGNVAQAAVDRIREAADMLEFAAETRALFDKQQIRMMKATNMWVAEDPEARSLILPDLGALIDWLIERGDKAIAAIDEVKATAWDISVADKAKAAAMPGGVDKEAFLREHIRRNWQQQYGDEPHRTMIDDARKLKTSPWNVQAELAWSVAQDILSRLNTSAIGAEGWRLVPVEPTPEMRQRGVFADVGTGVSVPDIWAAMLAAAPTPPTAHEVPAHVPMMNRDVTLAGWFETLAKVYTDNDATADEETARAMRCAALLAKIPPTASIEECAYLAFCAWNNWRPGEEPAAIFAEWSQKAPQTFQAWCRVSAALLAKREQK